MSSASSWLVKVKRYDGSESVIHSSLLKEQAKAIASNYNDQYQSDNYYAEMFDLQKFNWPSADHLIDGMD